MLRIDKLNYLLNLVLVLILLEKWEDLLKEIEKKKNYQQDLVILLLIKY